MTLEVAWHLIPHLLAGLVLLGLAGLLLRLGFFVQTHRALALFLAMLGALRVLLFISSAPQDAAANYWSRVAVYYALAVDTALIAFATVYLRGLRGRPASPWSMTPFLAIMAATSLAYALDHSLYFGQDSPLQLFQTVTYNAYPVVALLFVRAYSKGRPEATSILLIAVAVALVPGADDAVRLMRTLGGTSPFHVTDVQGILFLGGFILRIVLSVALAAWLFVLASRAPKGPRRAIIGYAGLLVFPYAAGAAAAPFLEPGGLMHALRGVWHAFSALLITYAFIRGRFLGIDVKVRFAISKSTIAAVFIAVFFVASEAAQQFFGDRFQSGYLGILAAGALVFAIAPLSRVADRLAEKAVPITGASAASGTSPRSADTYRRAVRLALKDRKLTTDEEVELAQVAHDLGLSAPDATRIRHEVEHALHASRPRRGRGVA